MKYLQHKLYTCWSFFRHLINDNAYERYVEHHRLSGTNCSLLNQTEFYKQELERKWSGVRRCC